MLQLGGCWEGSGENGAQLLSALIAEGLKTFGAISGSRFDVLTMQADDDIEAAHAPGESHGSAGDIAASAFGRVGSGDIEQLGELLGRGLRQGGLGKNRVAVEASG